MVTFTNHRMHELLPTNRFYFSFETVEISTLSLYNCSVIIEASLLQALAMSNIIIIYNLHAQ